MRVNVLTIDILGRTRPLQQREEDPPASGQRVEATPRGLGGSKEVADEFGDIARVPQTVHVTTAETLRAAVDEGRVRVHVVHGQIGVRLPAADHTRIVSTSPPLAEFERTEAVEVSRRDDAQEDPPGETAEVTRTHCEEVRWCDGATLVGHCQRELLSSQERKWQRNDSRRGRRRLTSNSPSVYRCTARSH